LDYEEGVGVEVGAAAIGVDGDDGKDTANRLPGLIAVVAVGWPGDKSIRLKQVKALWA
jgi:hypothetical protein